MSENKVRLLCLPCAGASATMYFKWRRLLPAWIQVEPIELPGRGTLMSEAFIQDFDQLVELLCQRHLDNPNSAYALFGHSMGALLAYGMASRMQKKGLPLPLLLFASASPAPSKRDISRFPDSNDRDALIADMRQQGGTPDELFENQELLQLSLDVLAADYRICRSFEYVSDSSLPLPIHALGGRDDDISASRMLAWQAVTSTGFDMHWFDGGHFYIRQNEAQVISLLSRHLQNEINKAPNVSVVLA